VHEDEGKKKKDPSPISHQEKAFMTGKRRKKRMFSLFRRDEREKKGSVTPLPSLGRKGNTRRRAEKGNEGIVPPYS